MVESRARVSLSLEGRKEREGRGALRGNGNGDPLIGLSLSLSLSFSVSDDEIIIPFSSSPFHFISFLFCSPIQDRICHAKIFLSFFSLRVCFFSFIFLHLFSRS